jgi:hypothetical protein
VAFGYVLRAENERTQAFSKFAGVNRSLNPLGPKIDQLNGVSGIKRRLKPDATTFAMSISPVGALLDFFSGNLTRGTLLFVVIPISFLSYFGTLAFAIVCSPKAYDWRYSVISHLISPQNNPEFHTVPSFGIAITGLLIIPFAGYINRGTRVASRFGANIGSLAFTNGAICLVLAGLIVSRNHHGTSNLPSVHEIFARTAAFAIGTGLISFCWCALKGYFIPAQGKRLYQRRLLISWSLLTLAPIFGIMCSESLLLIMRVHLPWSYQSIQVLKSSVFWHLAFWEWVGSGAVFLFLLSAALFLPRQPAK